MLISSKRLVGKTKPAKLTVSLFLLCAGEEIRELEFIPDSFLQPSSDKMAFIDRLANSITKRKRSTPQKFVGEHLVSCGIGWWNCYSSIRHLTEFHIQYYRFFFFIPALAMWPPAFTHLSKQFDLNCHKLKASVKVNMELCCPLFWHLLITVAQNWCRKVVVSN